MITPIEALRQVAFPDFPHYDRICERNTIDMQEAVAWYCTRHPGHDGPHMATYFREGEDHDCEVIGFAWTEEAHDDDQ